MYVIIESGGKQYRLSNNDTVNVEKLDAGQGKTVTMSSVLLYADGKNVEIGKPYLKNVKVTCEVLGAVKGPKTISFKYKRRKSSRRKIGHRQQFTTLKVKEISVRSQNGT